MPTKTHGRLLWNWITNIQTRVQWSTSKILFKGFLCLSYNIYALSPCNNSLSSIRSGLQWRGGDSSMCPVTTLSSIWKTARHATAAKARHLPRHSLVGREMNLDAACPPFISLDRLPLPGSARMGSSSLQAGEHISAGDEEITVCAALWSDSWAQCHLVGY